MENLCAYQEAYNEYPFLSFQYCSASSLGCFGHFPFVLVSFSFLRFFFIRGFINCTVTISAGKVCLGESWEVLVSRVEYQLDTI